ncbi:MAG: hypothetical protein ACOCRZ_03165 [Halothermotrichaceae bacterium]
MDLKQKILILGEGGAGSEIVKTLMNLYPDKYNCALVVASSSEREKITDIENELTGLVQLDIDGTGKNPKTGITKARDKANELDELIGNYPIIFHVLGFGGGTGVGSAYYLGQTYQKKLHMFVGALPTFSEGKKIITNALTAVSSLEKWGRIWPIDNRHNENELFYKKINYNIAKHINHIFDLPKINSVTKDMDSGNVLDILFPEDFRKQGIFTYKKYNIQDFQENFAFDRLEEVNNSVSYHFDFKYFGVAGVVIKLKAYESYNSAKDYVVKFEDWLKEKMPGVSLHQAIYSSDAEENQITLLISGPVLHESQFSDYIEEHDRLQSSFENNFKELLDNRFRFKPKKGIKFDREDDDYNPYQGNDDNIESLF